MIGDPEALADMARNRGLKLVRSRVRTPGKPGFGRFGLTDPAGAAVFGMAGKRPDATGQEIADFLRTAEQDDWKASLDQSGARPSPGVKRKASAPASPKPRPVAAPPPKPVLREARPADAAALAELFALLDHRLSPAKIAANLKALKQQRLPVLVMAEGDRLLGACALARTVNPHRPQPVGRITVLVVAADRQRGGIGRLLVAEAERRLQALGCGLIEVTSNDRLTAAHAFYRRLGFERTSMRFAKTLPSG